MLIRKFCEEITFLGGSVFYILFASLFLFNKQYNLFFLLFFGLFFIFFFFLIIRVFYFKPRPKKASMDNFWEKIDASSFPSRHSARTTFLLIFVASQYISNAFLIGFSFFLGLFVFYSRVYLDKHYFEDILGGIVLGALAFLVSFTCILYKILPLL